MADSEQRVVDPTRRVRIKSDGFSRGTTVTDIATGEPVPNLVAVTIAPITVDAHLVTAQLFIGFTELDIVAEAGEPKPAYQVRHPETGKLRMVKSIEFVDGEILEL